MPSRRVHCRQPARSTTRRRIRGLGSQALVALLLAGATAVSLAVDGAAASDESGAKIVAAVNVRDHLDRGRSGNLGRALLGGRYATSGSMHAMIRGGRAAIGPLGSGRSVQAWLPAVHTTDQRFRVTVQLPKRVGFAGEWVGVKIRLQRGGAAYRAQVRVDRHRRLTLQIARIGTGGRVLATRVLPGRIAAGHPFYVDAVVTGQSPVVVRARAYPTGHATVGWQLSAADSSSRRIRTAGAVGFIARTPKASAATRVDLLDLLGWVFRRQAGHAKPRSSSPTPTKSSSSPTTAAPTPTGSGQASSPPPTGGSTTPTPPANGGAAERGALPVGTATYPVPDGALFVSPTQGNDANAGTEAEPLRTVAAAVSRAADGGTVVLRGGTYHERLFIGPTKRLTIQAYPGEAVWFDGSVPVTSWTQEGSTWVARNWTAQFDSSASYTRGSDAGGFVSSNYPMAAHPDQVFLDGQQLAQVAAGVTPRVGQFAVDYGAHTLTIGSDPTGHELRASDLDHAFVVAGTVTLRGFGVRRYATPLPDIGTIFFGGSAGGDVVQNVVVRDNATQGIGISVRNVTIDHVTAAANGMSGMMANTSDNLVIENSLLAGNNVEHFNSEPSAAGVKIGRSNGVTVRNNDVLDNIAENGIWTDITVRNFTIVGNVVRNSRPYGILTELSDTGIVANNSISGAKYGYTAFDTGNVKVFNNAFSDNSVWDVGCSQDARRNTDPATMSAAPWLVRNVQTSNNRFGSTALFQFYALDKATGIPAGSMNLVVDGNSFPAPATGGPVMVGWGGSDNTTVTYYRTPAALRSGLQVTWANLQPGTTTLAAQGASTDDGVAVPLPADVAAAVGQPAGTRHIGPF